MRLIETSLLNETTRNSLPDPKRTDEKLKLLVQNISHPSLRVKKVQKYKGVFKGSVIPETTELARSINYQHNIYYITYVISLE